MNRRAALLALAAAAMAFALPAAAQSWPSKPVRMMVGSSPGGGTDIIARMSGKELA
jgi:tripartite-type tricarboxylate transporter receptor subunit TctC